jgi:hypothetical protein
VTNIVTEIVVPRPRCRPDVAATLPHQLLQLVIIAVAFVFLGNFDKLSEAGFKSNYAFTTLDVEKKKRVAEVGCDTGHKLSS